MSRNFDRIRRISEQMRRDLAKAVRGVIPHAHANFISITAVRVTRDLSFAKVYVTHVLDNQEERDEIVALLNQYKGQLRHALAQGSNLRKMPELEFFYDDSVEYGARMEDKLRDLVKDLSKESE